MDDEARKKLGQIKGTLALRDQLSSLRSENQTLQRQAEELKSIFERSGYPIAIQGINDESYIEFRRDHAMAVRLLHNEGRSDFGEDPTLGKRLSFDAKLEPFVGESQGYNHADLGMRRKLLQGRLVQSILPLIRFHASTTAMPGGRFFISNTGLRIRQGNMQSKQIGSWLVRVTHMLELEILRVVQEGKDAADFIDEATSK